MEANSSPKEAINNKCFIVLEKREEKTIVWGTWKTHRHRNIFPSSFLGFFQLQLLDQSTPYFVLG
jgi:hypothetical protein